MSGDDPARAFELGTRMVIRAPRNRSGPPAATSFHQHRFPCSRRAACIDLRAPSIEASINQADDRARRRIVSTLVTRDLRVGRYRSIAKMEDTRFLFSEYYELR